jgi:hypothetical protein
MKLNLLGISDWSSYAVKNLLTDPILPRLSWMCDYTEMEIE